MNGLNGRQKGLYEFLSKSPDSWFTQRQIYENVEGYIWNDTAWDKCSQIAQDMNEININGNLEKIIVMKNRCFKIGNKEEVKRYYVYHIKKLKKNVAITKSILVRVLTEGQGVFLDNDYRVLLDDAFSNPYGK